MLHTLPCPEPFFFSKKCRGRGNLSAKPAVIYSHCLCVTADVRLLLPEPNILTEESGHFVVNTP